MYNLTFDAIQYNESKTKNKRRKLILESCFKLCVQNGIRHLTIEQLMSAAHFEFRTFYNYYESVNILLEDIMISAMLAVYDYEYFRFYEGESLFDILMQYGDQFIAHAYELRDVVIYIDDYDHHFTFEYVSERYTEMVKRILTYPMLTIQKFPVLAKAFENIEPTIILENIQMFTSTLFIYLSRLIRRENIYSHNLTFLSQEGLHNLKRSLAVAVSQRLESYRKQI